VGMRIIDPAVQDGDSNALSSDTKFGQSRLDSPHCVVDGIIVVIVIAIIIRIISIPLQDSKFLPWIYRLDPWYLLNGFHNMLLLGIIIIIIFISMDANKHGIGQSMCGGQDLYLAGKEFSQSEQDLFLLRLYKIGSITLTGAAMK